MNPDEFPGVVPVSTSASPASSVPEAVIMAKPATPRLMSIDALRGFDMFWIIGAEGMVQAWLKYSNVRAGHPANDESSWQMILYRQLQHVTWGGFRFYDLIFPLFLFIIGVMIPFSMNKIKAAGEGTGAMLWRITRRVILILALGLIYNNFLSFNFPDIRYAGVLQRLGICYGLAALAYLFLKVRGVAILTVVLLVGYYFLLLLVPAPGIPAGDITKQNSLAGYVDRVVLKEALGGKLYYGFGDNEGVLSTIPAVATALIGVLAGCWLLRPSSNLQKFLGLVWSGLILLAIGGVWSGFFTDMNNLHDRLGLFPVNKILWTSTYVLWAGGWSLLLLALFFGIIDCLGWRAWSWPFVFIGANAITIYLLDHFLNFDPLAKRFFGGVARVTSDWIHPLLQDDPTQRALHGLLSAAILLTGALFLKWLLTWFLYKRKIFIRV